MLLIPLFFLIIYIFIDTVQVPFVLLIIKWVGIVWTKCLQITSIGGKEQELHSRLTDFHTVEGFLLFSFHKARQLFAKITAVCDFSCNRVSFASLKQIASPWHVFYLHLCVSLHLISPSPASLDLCTNVSCIKLNLLCSPLQIISHSPF